MTFRKRTFLIPFCFSLFTPKAYAADSNLDFSDTFKTNPPGHISTKANLKHKKAEDVPRYEIIVPSFVVHGMQPSSEAAANMPRKMVGSGDAVITPGIGLEYKGDSGFLAMGAAIKDCYNDLAGTLQVGEYWRINKNQIWGVTFGVYARETPLVCNGIGNCYDIDSYSLKFVTYVNGESVDIMPMPFIHYSYVLYKDKDIQINFKFMGNIALNEFGLDIPF
jgi:hypothetical protein